MDGMMDSRMHDKRRGFATHLEVNADTFVRMGP